MCLMFRYSWSGLHSRSCWKSTSNFLGFCNFWRSFAEQFSFVEFTVIITFFLGDYYECCTVLSPFRRRKVWIQNALILIHLYWRLMSLFLLLCGKQSLNVLTIVKCGKVLFLPYHSNYVSWTRTLENSKKLAYRIGGDVDLPLLPLKVFSILGYWTASKFGFRLKANAHSG